MGIEDYRAFHRRSLEDREAFWMEQARGIEWRKEPERALAFDNPPFARWFVGGETNLCHNAVDRHLAQRGEQAAVIWVSTETGERRSYSYGDLHR